jgi:hypothetical protein
MTEERYEELMWKDKGSTLTMEEYDLGWHFCVDWDFLLIGPGMAETDCCTCKKVDDGN